MTSKYKVERVDKTDYAVMAYQKANENHLWINAFHCINPSDDLKIEIGEWVLRKLKEKENLIPSSLITDENETAREIGELTPILYLSVNKS